MKLLMEEVELLRRIPLFAAIDAGSLRLLAFASQRLLWNSGEYVFRQGEYGDTAYVIISGSVDVVAETSEGEIILATLHENEMIGEIAILCDVPRTASIRAHDPLTMLQIKKESFMGLIKDSPELGRAVMQELANRVHQTTQELSRCREELRRATKPH